MAKKRSNRKIRHSFSKAAVGKGAGMMAKKPIILADVESRAHAMHRSSGLIIYWLSFLSLVVLNMLSAVAVSVLQFAMDSQKVLLIVAGLGFFFGYVSNKFVGLADNLEVRHHIFARLVIPAAAVLNLVIITSAANGLASFSGIGYQHSPALVGLAYGVAFALPSLASAAAAVLRPLRTNGKKNK